MVSQSSNVFRVVDLSLDSPVSPLWSPGGFQSGCAFLRLISSSDRFGTSLANIRSKKCQIFTARVRTMTGVYVFTGFCLLTEGRGVPQGPYSPRPRYLPLRSGQDGGGVPPRYLPLLLARSGRREGVPQGTYPPSAQGLATRRAVYLLRSRRRTFLFRV